MNIKQLRKNNGWTQTDLAEKISISQKLVADYETGATKPPLDRVILFAKVFEVSTDELLGVTEIIDLSETNKIAEHGNSRSAKMNKIFKSLSDIDQKSVLNIVKKMG